MLPEDRIRLEHMLEAAQKARSLVGQRQREDLDHDEFVPIYAPFREALSSAPLCAPLRLKTSSHAGRAHPAEEKIPTAEDAEERRGW